MNPRTKNLLLPFYFGTVAETERLAIERELLIDSEVLVDYLDLKRSMEAAQATPEPSAQLWFRLQDRLREHKRWVLPVSLGFALVCALLLWSMLALKPKTGTVEVLFDSNTELSSSSAVL